MKGLPKGNERRSAPDRRKEPTRFACKHTFCGGQRRDVRRGGDKRKYLFVDLYSSRLWIAVLTVTVLTLVDAYLTLSLIEMKIFVEANPIMAFFLGHGNSLFIVAKSLFTSLALFFLCLTQNYVLSKISLAFAILVYLSVILYEVSLLYKFHLA